MERREALEKAFDDMEKAEKGGEEEVEETEDEAPEGEEGQEEEHEEGEQDGESSEEQGEEGDTESEGSGKEDKEGKPAGKKPDEETPYERAARASSEGPRAPQSWKPAVREHWAKLPPAVRAEVARREQEIERYVSQNDHHRRFVGEFQQVVQPFLPLIQAQRSTPMRAIQNLMTTAAGLMMGTAQQKAAIVAEIVQNYGVDLETLDKTLAGQGGGGGQPNGGGGGIPPQFMQALQPVYQFMDEVRGMRSQREQQQRQSADEQTAQFSQKVDFFDDVREDMADIMEIAARRGQRMTLDQAYAKAVQLNPEVKKILDQRARAAAARKNGGTRIAKAKRAASTISGGPAGHPDGKATPKDRRAQLEAAWDDAVQS